MNGYLISTSDRPGIAAAIFGAAAARGVNVFPAYGLSDGTTGLIVVGSDDEAIAGVVGQHDRDRARDPAPVAGRLERDEV